MHTNNNEQLLLNRGIEWIKSEHKQFVKLYTQVFASINVEYYQKMSEEQLHRVATTNLDALIHRLEGVSIDANRLKTILISQMAQGLSLETLVNTSNQLEAVVITKTYNDLHKQPQVREVLLKKVSYCFKLVQASMAAAAVDYQMQKI